MDDDQKRELVEKQAQIQKDLAIKQTWFRSTFQESRDGHRVLEALKKDFGFRMSQVAEATGDRQQQMIGNAEVIEYIEQILRIEIPTATEKSDGD